jgi:predicted transglutaminase-like cysteine proteinase
MAAGIPASDAARKAEPANSAAAFAPNGVFHSLEFETNATTGIDSWRKFSSRLAKEHASYRACDAGQPACPPALRAWRAKLADWATLSPRAKLIHVNRWANAALRYTEDSSNYQSADHWATPSQSLQGRGDCEDYALLKYATLRELGFAEQNLRIVVVNDLHKRIGHAVLSVRTAGGVFILDNQDSRVLRHDSIARYAPIYSINANTRWINIATRDLKPRKTPPVLLLASADELMLPATQSTMAASATAEPVILPVLKPQLAKATAAGAPWRQRLSATATAALLSPPAVDAHKSATSAPPILIRLTPLAASLLNSIWPFATTLANRG